MASVHTTVSIHAFNGLEHGIAGACFLFVRAREGEGLIERLAYLFEAKTYSPGEDTYGS